MKTQIGGDRLGSGNKQEVSLKNFNRSTHDLGYIWRSSMASGTLVPFMSEVGLPGDTFDIDLFCDVKTLPTLGPLFGSYKVQLDVFECPIRLYNGKLHMNMLNIGLDMSEVLLPQLEVIADWNQSSANYGDNTQISPSSILSYLNIRGVGRSLNGQSGDVKRNFNAVPFLSFWDIYKNYYANKQEERGYVIHSKEFDASLKTLDCEMSTYAQDGQELTGWTSIFPVGTAIQTGNPSGATNPVWEIRGKCEFKFNSVGLQYGQPDMSTINIAIDTNVVPWDSVFTDITYTLVDDPAPYYIVEGRYIGPRNNSSSPYTTTFSMSATEVKNTEPNGQGEPQLEEFPLSNIDDMRMDILEDVRATTPFIIDQNTYSPYGLVLDKDGGDWANAYKLASQEGLAIKTYQSDLFNNWISTEWIDGTNGINEVTAVSTAGNEFTIDALNLANKVYNMLNRIAISGGSYDDWLDAVYTHERSKGVENPIYHGSLIKELAFEEVVSNASTETGTFGDQALGELAGRGRLTKKHKGGKVKIKVSEPSYIMGIVSITPRIDYSQGNKWDVNLKSMNDLHKPSLDAIGFQDLITDQMAWFDTKVNFQGDVEYQTAGKQPAWINYMTNVNQCRGNFAVKNSEMFMTLNRKYEQAVSGSNQGGIGDLTTYIDPSKYNQIFAQTSRDSQNFWVQISNKIIARRKMSAKVIPNL